MAGKFMITTNTYLTDALLLATDNDDCFINYY